MAARLPMRIGGFKMVVLALLTALLASCASSGHSPLRANTGDMIVERLKLGMSNTEIDAAIADLRKWIVSDGEWTLDRESLIFYMYQDNYHPKDVLKTVEVGTSCRYLEYWTNPAGHQTATVKLFYDADQRLRGWVNYPSAYSQDKFMHERLTSKLDLSESVRQRTTRAQVHAAIGMPTETIPPFNGVSKSILENHYWFGRIPTTDWTKQIEVFSYDIGGGQKRRVFVAFYPAGDALVGYGYDHAWEEAERYEREKAKSP